MTSTEQLSLEDALRRVEEHSPEGWIAFARYVVEQVARTNATFISDAVWEAGLGKTSNARALGPVMIWARKEGLIAPTGEFRKSAQAGCHGMPRRVWRSLIYRPANAMEMFA